MKDSLTLDAMTIKLEKMSKYLTNEKLVNQKLRVEMAKLRKVSKLDKTIIANLTNIQDENMQMRHKVFHTEAKNTVLEKQVDPKKDEALQECKNAWKVEMTEVKLLKNEIKKIKRGPQEDAEKQVVTFVKL